MMKLDRAWVGSFRVFALVLASLFLALASLPETAAAAKTAPLTGVAQIAGGGEHSCARTAAGAVRCWGNNFYGQLGDDSTSFRLTPSKVLGLSSGVSAVAAGWQHSCAITAGGGVKCWGSNSDGQVGDGTSTNLRTAPVDVSGLGSGVSAIAAGFRHSCALTNGGGVKCWGSNSAGQLGDGSTTPALTPVSVSGLSSGVSAIVAGDDHTCALTTGGGMKCWGANGSSQLGDGGSTPSAVPVNVSGLASGVIGIAAGAYHTCALVTGGGVKCWGDNGSGQVGDNTATGRPTPVNVVGLASGVSAIAVSGYHSCARSTGGAVKCWGYNEFGQVGDNSTLDRAVPTDVTGLASGIIAIALGGNHSCARTSAGGVKCWGSNGSGQLGNDVPASRVSPVSVVGLGSGVAGLAGGYFHSCARTTAGAVKCWGFNRNGELGDNSRTDRLTPVSVFGLSVGISAVATGLAHTCALTTGGAVKCWGSNSDGQLGDGTNTDRLIPVNVSGLASGVSAIAVGRKHTCALATGGALKCWGDNQDGQLGDGSKDPHWSPVSVLGLGSGVIAIGAGTSHTCAVVTGGAAKCWGRNVQGQIGDGTTTQSSSPVDVIGMASGVTSIVGGYQHTCALKSGGAKCWGNNYYGNLGDNSTTDRWIPGDVLGLSSGVSSLAAGYHHSCALTAAGGAKCWGRNADGQVGDNSIVDRWMAVDVLGLAGGVIALADGGWHNCALTAEGAAKCWGKNSFGQLGDGTAGESHIPVDVLVRCGGSVASVMLLLD